MPAALAALKKIQAALSSIWSGSCETKGHVTVAAAHGWPAPGQLDRSAQTGGCRLPTFDSVTSVWATFRPEGDHQKVDASTANELAADLARPFGQSTGRGFSFTQLTMHRGYQTLTMRQQDVFAPWIGPNHTATIRTLYEIGYILTHADPICSHLQWAEEYPFLVPNMANFGLDPTFSLSLSALDFEPKRLPCCREGPKPIGGFRVLCFTELTASVPIVLRLKPYYVVNIVPDAAPGRPKGRLLVFTVWKCLGAGNMNNRCWKTHLTSGSSERRWYGLGHAQYTFEWGECHCPNTYEINVDDICTSVASVRKSWREAPPEYTAVAEPGSWVIDMDKGCTM